MDSLTGILYLYAIIINFIAFIMMGRDKRKAERHQYRISERVLWQVAILGGSVGAYLGMKVYRHKTKHKQFALGFPLLVMLHCLFFIWLNAQL
ncbi:DUF1294 domain-containing protein [Bacillus sp. KH172YL63]|uniref:DUF1294 domain-containing protein n=1 Tax=Bacillus sp. KH172YL63 TaxID=2709784 RepID=UPI0013E458DB|nr:DUF1294 domain-containing protein [Bacillus sp. KH172YL63]BCB05082.1 hypothetical protein KH172YL63_32150 [Bacillus sp. KH172YL63]